jgi:hypothetical protein
MIASRFGDKYSNFGPTTTQEQLYRQVREYRGRYPDIALVPMENGAGPIPILMAGGISQSSTRTPSDNSAALSTDAIIDKFIHDYLAGDLVKLKPLDGAVADPEHNWVLAAKTSDTLLIYSRAGAGITLTIPLAHATYNAIWFDPSSGQAKNAPDISGKAGTIAKPDDKGWLLLLRATR